MGNRRSREPQTPRRFANELRLLGERISSVRKKKGLSLEKLAYTCGVSKGNLSEIEHGKRDPRYCTIRNLASCLGLTIAELLEGL